MSTNADRPEGEPPDALAEQRRLALEAAPGSPAIRDVAAAILHEHVRRGRRGLALCAAASGAGVTFVTAAVAMAMAQSGVRTLVIEANLRRPGLSGLLPPPNPGEPGLLQFLTGEVADPSSIITPEVAPDLSAIYAGGERADAADLFDTDRFELVVRSAMRGFELTLIDTPAANRCAETRRIAAVVGYAALVARRHVTMAEDLGILIKDLKIDRVELLGSIFNEG